MFWPNVIGKYFLIQGVSKKMAFFDCLSFRPQYLILKRWFWRQQGIELDADVEALINLTKLGL